MTVLHDGEEVSLSVNEDAIFHLFSFLGIVVKSFMSEADLKQGEGSYHFENFKTDF